MKNDISVIVDKEVIPMNVLILSCGTGGGHNAAGAAVQKQLQKQGHQVVMINPYQLKSNRLAGMIDKVYIGLVQKNSTLFGFVYRLGELYRRLPFPSPVYYINRKMAYILQEYLLRHPADVIITPHLYPAEIITNMKKWGWKCRQVFLWLPIMHVFRLRKKPTAMML